MIIDAEGLPELNRDLGQLLRDEARVIAQVAAELERQGREHDHDDPKGRRLLGLARGLGGVARDTDGIGMALHNLGVTMTLLDIERQFMAVQGDGAGG